MKDKWKGFFAKLGIGKIESNADGIFVKEADVDKFMALDTDNEKLKTEAVALTAKVTEAEQKATEAQSALTVKETELAGKTAELVTMTAKHSELSTEVDRLKGTETKVDVADAAIMGTGTKKLKPHERAAAKNAAALMGVDPDEEEDDEEEEVSEKKRKRD